MKILMLCFIFAIISAIMAVALTVTLNHPSDEWSTTSSTDFNFTPSGELNSLPWCALYTNASGTFTVKANYSWVLNGTNFVSGIGLGDSTGLIWAWNVQCYNGSDAVFGTNATFGVDWHLPSTTMTAPSNGYYFNNASGNLSFVPTDVSNLDDCDLYTNISGTWAVNKTFDSVTSAATYSMNTSYPSDGHYIWNVKCNQSSGDGVWAATHNRSFAVDATFPTAIKLTTPSNNTASSDSTPYIAWNQTTDGNFQKYVASASTSLSNLGGTVVSSKTVTSRTENYTTLEAGLADGATYYLWVEAFDLSGNAVNVSDIFYYHVDISDISVTLDYPSDGDYLSDNTPDFNVTVIDSNPSTCVLYLTNSSSQNLVINKTASGVVNGTPFNLTPTAMKDGTYQFNIGCNDSVGNTANVSSSLLSLIVDTANPTQPNLTATWHQTNSTDGTPTLQWMTSTETNFDKYVASAWNFSDGSLVDQNNVTVNYITLDLPTGTSYNFTVVAYDLAGNTAQSANTTDSLYYVDSICGTLYEGWNICGIVATTDRNLSVIGAETNAAMVAIWNTSHAFKTCNYQISPSGQYCDLNVGISSTTNITSVFIYVNQTTLWRNRTWSAISTSADISLNNNTPGWNIFSMFKRGGLTFEQLNMTSRLNILNVSMYSKRDNQAGTNTPYITQSGFSEINKGTRVEYGEALWVYYNGTGTTTFDVGGW